MLLAKVGAGDDVEHLFSLMRGSVPAVHTMEMLQRELRQLEHHSDRAILSGAELWSY